jgi:vanillate O-demethylase monooxygenase subunit
MPFLRNVWYAAGLEREVASTPLSRRILGERLVFFRTSSGKPAALEDRCPHRLLPLSKGRVVGEDIQCGYHGARFAVDGRCVLVPGQEEVPARAAVRSYPVRERYGFVWVWMGEPSLAGASQPCNLYSFLDRTDWNTLDGYTRIACNYELINDNLADITHTEFVHASTLGSEEVRAARGDGASERKGEQRFDANIVDGGMDFRFSVTNGRVNPTFERAFRRIYKTEESELLDFRMEFSFRTPGFWLFSPGASRPGTPAEQGLRFSSPIILTPEDELSSHYFYKTCQNYALEDPAETGYWHEQTSIAFEEDKSVLEAQQENVGAEFPDPLSRVSFKGDAMSFQIRKLIRASLAAESGRNHATNANRGR